MNSTRAQHEKAYVVALDRHDGKFGIQEAKRRLEHTGLNSNSAADFIYNIGHLLRGEGYKREMSVSATDHFLAWIRRDRGDEALANALEALRQHIAYRNDQKGLTKPELRKVLGRHQALLSTPADSLLILNWKDKESAGFTDEFPLDWFASVGTLIKKQHVVRDRQGNLYRAYCDVTVNGKAADLDYEAYPKENAPDKMLLGVIRLIFEDEDRCSLASVKWKPRSSKVFADAAYSSPNVRVPPEKDYTPPTAPSAKVDRRVRERLGQPAFRRKLKSVYANRCCISGCTVTEALEGAHIDPYMAPASDNIRNGLLLRSDLHTLFDRHLIAIDPNTMRVHVSKRARCAAGYEQVHGLTLRVPDEPTHRPDQEALRRHWQNKQE
ncbi:MAG: HNH endonuclease [Verrucomicrobiaceae bacterium]|nr:HNH endonuclease [Verrucomicrobiaceae bacterium]